MFERKNERLKSVALLKDTLCGKKGRYYLGLTHIKFLDDPFSEYIFSGKEEKE